MGVSFGQLHHSPTIAVLGMAYLVKHVLETFLCQRTALDVFDGVKILSKLLSLLELYHRLLALGKLVPQFLVGAQILLRSDDEEGHAGAVMVDFGGPFLGHVFERGGRCNAEADEEDVGLGV